MKQMHEAQNLEPTKKGRTSFFFWTPTVDEQIPTRSLFYQSSLKKKNLSYPPHSLMVSLKMDPYYYSAKDAHP